MLKTKFVFRLLMSIFLTLGLSVSFQSLLADWTSPSANPPDGNPNKLITDASSDPAYYQLDKSLLINGFLSLNDNAILNNKWLSGDGDDEGVFVGANGNVGIGTNNPSSNLSIVGPAPANQPTVNIVNTSFTTINSNGLSVQGGGDSIDIGYEFRTLDRLGNVDFFIRGDGNVGIGVSNPAEKLEVAGNIIATSFLYSSDERLKTDIITIPNALDKVLGLRGVEFLWKNNNEKDIGVIAQEIEKVLPEIVHTDSKTGLKSVEYGNITAILIEAIKSQQLKIEELEKEIIILKNND